MNWKNKLAITPILFQLFLLCLTSTGYSQVTSKSDLTKVLKQVEVRFDVVFTYLDADVQKVTLTPPDSLLSLDSTLVYLQQITGLNYRIIDNRFIAISQVQWVPMRLCGYIKDRETKSPLASVFIYSNDIHAISDEEGYFEITILPKIKSAHVSLLGYDRMTFSLEEIPKDTCFQILLDQTTITLEQITISNYLLNGIYKRVDGSVVINSTQVGTLPGLIEPDVLQSLQALPGIQSINETVSDINVRGGTNDQNLILWDNIRMYQSGHFFGMISAFNPYFTNQTMLIKNGTSAATGGTTSSTIDIQSDDKVAKEMSGTTGINLLYADALLKIPLSNKSSLHVSGRRSYADLYKTLTFDQYETRAFGNSELAQSTASTDSSGQSNDFYFVDTAIKYLNDISDQDKLRISFIASKNNVDYQESEILNNTVVNKTSSLAQKSVAAGLTYQRLWSQKVKTSLNMNISSYELEAVNYDIINEQRLLQENEVLDLTAQLDMSISLSQQVGLSTGYQFSEIGITNLNDVNNPNYRKLEKGVLNKHVFFAEGIYNSKSDRTNGRLGIRTVFYSSINKLLIEPRLSMTQQLSERWSVELLAEMKSQSTSQVIDFQSDFLGVEKRRWVLSNDKDLPIAQSKQLSMGLSYRYGGLLMVLEGYVKSVDGIIANGQGFQNQFQYEKAIGNYEVTGADLLVNTKLNNLYAWASYSIAQNKYQFDTFVPPSFPNNLDITHTLTLGAAYQVNGFEFSAGLNARTGKPYTLPVENNEIINQEINYKAPNSARLSNYMRIDLSAKYKFRLSDKIRASAGVSVWNITNRENILNIYYRPIGDGQVEEVTESALAITPNLNFRINF